MTISQALPRILVIDDLFGRSLPDRRNFERVSLCRKFRLQDVTDDELPDRVGTRVAEPIAQVVFVRGQQPTCSTVGDTVENDLEGTLEVIRSGWVDLQPGEPRWAMALLDLCFYTGKVTEQSDENTPGMPEGRPGDEEPSQYFGLRLLKAIHLGFPELPVIILSSKERRPVSREFSANGALGFLPRSDSKSTAETLREYLWRHSLIEDGAGEVVGRSKVLLLALRAARRAALAGGNVLIRGERGVGKELLAKYLHRNRPAPRRGKPMITVNSAVLTPELYASALFGHVKGAFTGATSDRVGYIKLADGGDLFLDEIKDMLPEVQAGILRVLEEGTVTCVGASAAENIDVRFLSATNSDLESLAASGAFREDLLDRLQAGGKFILPPLRDRKEDVPLLVEQFIRDAEQRMEGAMRRDIEPAALDMLIDYDWPGNVRQLQTCIFQAVRDYRDLEHLMPIHITLPRAVTPSSSDRVEVAEASQREQPSAAAASPSAGRRGSLVKSDIDALISAISGFNFGPAKGDELAGRLDQLQGATARLLAEYLKAALVATSRLTPEHPEGEIKIHPAGKLITGDSSISASQAADIIKRLLKTALTSTDLVRDDPILAAAYDTARRLRPSYPKKKKGTNT